MHREDPNDPFSWKRNFNITFSLMLMHQRALTVPMRSYYGIQGLGTPCFFALVMMFLWTIFTQDNLMWVWMGIWIVCFIQRRWQSVRLYRKGYRIHTQYDGFPFDTIRFGRTEKACKLVVEPLLIGILGGIAYWYYGEQGWSPYGLPYFLLSGVFSLPFIELVKQTIWEKQIRALNDARIEQEMVVKEIRDRYGDSQ
jgi:hypothetical protein